MKTFATTKLELYKSVKKGDKESLLSLFRVADRFKHINVLADAEEDMSIKVTLEGLGKADLKLGADMETGQKKTIMTLFGYSERSKPVEMMKDAETGELVTIKMYKSGS